MSSNGPEPFHAPAVLRRIQADFESLALELQRLLDSLPADQAQGADGDRLRSAKEAAEKGAALVRNKLPRD